MSLPPTNIVCEGYVFTGVCLSIGGVLSQHALQVVSQHALQQGGLLRGGHLVQGVPGLGGSPPGQSPWGVLLGGVWTSVMAFWFGSLLLKVTFCYGLLLWSSVMVFWRGPEGHHTRRPPQRGCLVETPRMATAAGGTHPTGIDSCRA